MAQGAALALTLAVESMVILAALRWRGGTGIAAARAVAAALSPSLVTHPLAWRAALALSAEGYVRGLFAIEAAVVFAEALLLRLLLGPRPAGWSWRDVLLLSLAANLASWAVGYALQRPWTALPA